MLISLTGCTGLTMPDRPFTDPRDHKPIMAKPNLNMAGRTAGSPDNAQGTHFFMINDTGTYFLRKLPPPEDATASVFDPETLIARAARGEGPAARPPHRRAGREPGLPGLPRLQPLPVEPARHHDPVPGRGPVPAVHQRDDVPAHPAGRRAAGDRRRPELLPAGRGEEVDQVGVPEQRHQAAARAPSGRCAPRSRPTCCCRTSCSPPTRWAWARGSTPRSRRRSCSGTRSSAPVRPDARLRLEHAQVEAGRHRCAGRCPCRGTPTCGRPGRPAAQGRVPDQGDVPAELPHDGRRRGRGGGREVRAAAASTPTRACSRASTAASSAPSTSRRPATTPRT